MNLFDSSSPRTDLGKRAVLRVYFKDWVVMVKQSNMGHRLPDTLTDDIPEEYTCLVTPVLNSLGLKLNNSGYWEPK